MVLLNRLYISGALAVQHTDMLADRAGEKRVKWILMRPLFQQVGMHKLGMPFTDDASSDGGPEDRNAEMDMELEEEDELERLEALTASIPCEAALKLLELPGPGGALFQKSSTRKPPSSPLPSFPI